MYVHYSHRVMLLMSTVRQVNASNSTKRRTDRKVRTMVKLIQGLRTVLALLKAGPGGHPIVSHHHLHKG